MNDIPRPDEPRAELKPDSAPARFAAVLARAEKGDAVNTQDLVNALWWRLRNQRREIARLREQLDDKTDIVAATAHRACCNEEHDPPNGRLSGYCVVCGIPWPCETARRFLRQES